jgi:hypothetical protein
MIGSATYSSFLVMRFGRPARIDAITVIHVRARVVWPSG